MRGGDETYMLPLSEVMTMISIYEALNRAFSDTSINLSIINNRIAIEGESTPIFLDSPEEAPVSLLSYPGYLLVRQKGCELFVSGDDVCLYLISDNHLRKISGVSSIIESLQNMTDEDLATYREHAVKPTHKIRYASIRPKTDLAHSLKISLYEALVRVLSMRKPAGELALQCRGIRLSKHVWNEDEVKGMTPLLKRTEEILKHNYY